MKVIYLITIALSIVCISCKKSKRADSFPAATEEGKNTIGAYVDGNPFFAGTTLFGLVRPVTVIYYTKPNLLYKAGFLSIAGIDARYGTAGAVAGDMVLNKVNIFNTGEYPLIDQAGYTSNFNVDGISYHNAASQKTYLAQSGKLTITKLDTANKIISGRFYFTAKDSLNSAIQITDGRFDAKYESY